MELVVHSHCILTTKKIALVEDGINILLCIKRETVDRFFQVTKSGKANWGFVCLADLWVMGIAADLLEATLHFIST